MLVVRSIAGRIAAASLCLHLLSITAPAVAAAALPDGELACTCATGNHAMCPIHHRASKTGCAVRAAAEDATAILTPLTFLAVLASPSRAARLAHQHAIDSDLEYNSPSRPHTPPDPPPPRA